jgi:hypothetical protein
MQCLNSDCGASVPSNSPICVACGEAVGAPNVRAALCSSELTALDYRYKNALDEAKKEGREENFFKIQSAAAMTQAVICMPLVRLLPVLMDDASLISTYSLQIASGLRSPQSGGADSVRNSVEEAFFPNYSQHIRFAALSFDGWGQTAYGGCSVELKEVSVRTRSTVFDSPLFNFATNNGVVLTNEVPKGFRATWGDRAKLAAAKIGAASDASTEQTCARLFIPLVEDTRSDCIEVHIYGPLNRHSISRVSMAKEIRKPDILIQEAVREMLEENGAAIRLMI